MKKIIKKLEIKTEYNLYIANTINIEDTIIFDIETTGFASKSTKLYLIGCIYFDTNDNSYYSIQWFRDNEDDEPIIISAFFEFANSYKNIIHYNGNGFDIPYIEAKCKFYNIQYDFSSFNSIDVYKLISKIKNIFKLENIKQKTIESFLDIKRTDQYSGGDLISVYSEYMKNHDQKSEQLILLHNEDDICCLLKILSIVNYISIFDGKFDICGIEIKDKSEKREAIIECNLHYELPKRVSNSFSSFYFTAYANKLYIKINIYEGGLKFFYPNYKDYYYLPHEDCSIHKSVAFYVDKEFRTKAKAANCYSKKTGRFLPQNKIIVDPYFKIDYDDKITYFELTDELLQKPDLLFNYSIDLLDLLKQ